MERETTDQHRAVVQGERGMVASAHYLASYTGANVLAQGGNAVDAALVMAFMTGVVLPQMCGLGGDAFMLYYQARTGTVTAYQGSGPAAAGVTADHYRQQGLSLLPLTGLHAAAVAGAVDAYAALYRDHASWDWAQLTAPAVHYARTGVPVCRALAEDIVDNQEKLAQDPGLAALYLPHGRPLERGERLVQPDLADSLTRLGQGGRDWFYRGAFRDRVVHLSRATNGPFTGEEWERPITEVGQPLTTEYRGHRIHQLNPPSQGVIHLEAMNLLERAWKGGDSLSADAVHAMLEALKLAIADRIRFLGESPAMGETARRLASLEHADRRAALIDPVRARSIRYHQPGFDGDTTSFVVVDRDGNAVSFIHSLSHAFGSGVMVPGTGVTLNNRAGRGFNLEVGHPNEFAPMKRTMHTLNCWIVTRGGRLTAVGGTPGGDGQPQWNTQIVSHLLDGGLNVQQAVEAPRFTQLPATDPHSWDQDPEVRMEDRMPAEVVRALVDRGHPVRLVGSWQGGGGAQVIVADRDGFFAGGSDPRVDGQAIGF